MQTCDASAADGARMVHLPSLEDPVEDPVEDPMGDPRTTDPPAPPPAAAIAGRFPPDGNADQRARYPRRRGGSGCGWHGRICAV